MLLSTVEVLLEGPDCLGLSEILILLTKEMAYICEYGGNGPDRDRSTRSYSYYPDTVSTSTSNGGSGRDLHLVSLSSKSFVSRKPVRRVC